MTSQESDDLQEETLDDEIVEQLLALTDKSFDQNMLSDLSMSESHSDLDSSRMNNRKINKDKASKIITDYYIEIIVKYFNTYIDYLTSKSLIFENNIINILTKKLNKMTPEEITDDILYIKSLLKIMFFIECSLVNNNVTQIYDFVHYENDTIQDLYNKVKLNKSLKKLLNNFTFYKNYIDIIEDNIDINTEDYLSETNVEESSEDIVEECFNINKNVDIYMSKNYPDQTNSQVDLVKALMCFRKIITHNLYSIEDFEDLIMNNEDVNKIIDENIDRYIQTLKSKPKKKKVKKDTTSSVSTDKPKKKKKKSTTSDTTEDPVKETTKEDDITALQKDAEEIQNEIKTIEVDIEDNNSPTIEEKTEEKNEEKTEEKTEKKTQ